MISLSRDPILTKYVITRDLPSGFFGPTFIVHPKENFNESDAQNIDPTLDPESLVCKVVHKSFLGPRSRLSGFLERIRLLSELNLSFVEPFVDIIESDEDLFLFRRFIPFGNLTDFSKQNPKGVNNNTIYHIWRLLANCLIQIHQNRICPSSLKPNNIFVVSENTILITDLFELTTDISLTIQTPDPFQLSFMAPEYFDRSAELSSYSDIWSLGMIIVFLKLGGLPWQTKNIVSMTKMITSPNPYLLVPLSNHESERENESDVTHLIRSILVHEAQLRPPAEALLDIQKIRSMSQLRKNVMQNPHFNLRMPQHSNGAMSERNYGMAQNGHTKILMQPTSPKRPFFVAEHSVPIRTTQKRESLFVKYTTNSPPPNEQQQPTQQSAPSSSFTFRCRFVSPQTARPLSTPSQPPLDVNQIQSQAPHLKVKASPSQGLGHSFLEPNSHNLHGNIPLPPPQPLSTPSIKKPHIPFND